MSQKSAKQYFITFLHMFIICLYIMFYRMSSSRTAFPNGGTASLFTGSTPRVVRVAPACPWAVQRATEPER